MNLPAMVDLQKTACLPPEPARRRDKARVLASVGIREAPATPPRILDMPEQRDAIDFE